MTMSSAGDAAGSRRDGILRAALGCFDEVGYAATTVDEIRRRAGASVGSMYHHFAGKEQLAAALIVEGRRDYYAAWLDSLKGRRTAEGGVRAAVRRHFEWMPNNLALGRFVFGFEEPAAVAVAAGPFRLIRTDFQDQLLGWLRPYVESRDIQHLPDDLYEPLWMAAAQSFTRQWLRWDDHNELTRFSRHFADGAWAALRRP
jgi:AcrR family transcriptional regulator